MPKYGTRSRNNLATAHPELQRLFNEVIKYYDCSILCGHRTKEEQEKVYNEGRSKVRWPNSKHNANPSKAVDAVPWFSNEPHIRWHDKAKFYEFGGFVQGVAATMGIKIRWGGNWDSDDELHDQSFFDLPHFELLD